MQSTSNINIIYLPQFSESVKDPDLTAVRICLFDYIYSDPDDSPASLNGKEMAIIEITDSGSIALDYKHQLSKKDLSRVIKSVKLESQAFTFKKTQILESLLLKTLEKKEFLSKPALIKTLTKWAEIATPNENPEFLFLAIETGDLELIKKLVEKKHDFNVLDSNQCSPLAQCLILREGAILTYLVSFGVTLASHETEPASFWLLALGGTACIHRVTQINEIKENGHIKDFRIPQELQKDLETMRPMLESLWPSLPKEAMIEIALGGLKVMHYFNDTRLAGFLVCQLPHNEHLERLSMIKAQIYSSVDFIEWLIDQGVGDVKETFTLAAALGRKDILERLLVKRISLDCVVDESMEVASVCNQLDVIKFFLSQGARINIPTAIHSHSIECKDLLLKHELPGLSDYYFRLLMCTHCFQITHLSEHDPFEKISFQGFLNGDIGSVVSDDLDMSYTSRMYCPVKECVEGFRNGFKPINAWIEKANLEIKKIPDLILKTSLELAELYQKGEGIALYTPWFGHCTYVWIEGDVLFHSNTGERSQDKACGLSLYHIPDRSKVTPHLLEKLRRRNRVYIEQGVIQELDLKFIGVCSSQSQKGGFCSVRTLLMLFKGIMILKHMQEIPSETEVFAKFESSEKAIAEIYKKAKNGLMDEQLGKLLDLYESETFSFQPEISLLLMILAKLPLESDHTNRLIQFLKKAKCPIEMKSNGKNIFHYLKGKNQLRVMEELFGKEKVLTAIPQLINDSNELYAHPPLIQAMDEKRFENIKELVHLGADFFKGFTCAILSNRLDLVEILFSILDKEIQLKIVQELFMYALTNGSIHVLRYLLQEGANTNQVDINGISPLVHACAHKEKSLETVSLLLAAGADPLKKMGFAKSGIEYVIATGQLELLEMMFSAFDKEMQLKIVQELFIYALTTGGVNALPFFLKAGARVNEFTESGFLPLVFACNYIGTEVAELLLRNGADPFQCLPGFHSPHTYSIQYGRPDLAQLFSDWKPEGS